VSTARWESKTCRRWPRARPGWPTRAISHFKFVAGTCRWRDEDSSNRYMPFSQRVIPPRAAAEVRAQARPASSTDFSSASERWT